MRGNCHRRTLNFGPTPSSQSRPRDTLSNHRVPASDTGLLSVRLTRYNPRQGRLCLPAILDFLSIIMSPIQRVTRAQNHLEDSSPYGYRPSQAPGVAYLVLFSLAAILHIGLGFRYKYWIVFVTLIPGGLRECLISPWTIGMVHADHGDIVEIIGWAGRLWSSKNDLNSNPFFDADLLVSFPTSVLYQSRNRCIFLLRPPLVSSLLLSIVQPLWPGLADARSQPHSRPRLLLRLGLHRPRLLHHATRLRLLACQTENVPCDLRHGRCHLARPPGDRWGKGGGGG